jgi:hypothetical protein
LADQPIFTRHAEGQMLARGIEKITVTRILDSPTEIIRDEHEGTLKCHGKDVDPYTKRERCIVVIFVNLNNTRKVITAMPTDKGGKRQLGFNNI